jgi:hypothetical protein
VIFTPVQNLPCLDNDDYAGYALYMKCLAEQLEDSFNAKNDAFEAFRNRYAGVWRNTAAITDTAGSYDFSDVPNLFWNDPVNAPQVGTGTADDPVRFQFPGMVPNGLYEVGFTVAFNQGATSGSLRQVLLNVEFITTAGPVGATGTYDSTEETLTGGEFLQSNLQIGLTPRQIAGFTTGTTATAYGFNLFGTETDAGAITIPVGGITFWAIFIGTNELIGVA